MDQWSELIEGKWAMHISNAHADRDVFTEGLCKHYALTLANLKPHQFDSMFWTRQAKPWSRWQSHCPLMMCKHRFICECALSVLFPTVSGSKRHDTPWVMNINTSPARKVESSRHSQNIEMVANDKATLELVVFQMQWNKHSIASVKINRHTTTRNTIERWLSNAWGSCLWNLDSWHFEH